MFALGVLDIWADSLDMGKQLVEGSRVEDALSVALRTQRILLRRHARALPGTPDFSAAGARLAVFVHGCFWHGCPACKRNLTPKRNAEFWAEKRLKNQERDARVEAQLRAMGWEVLVFWECEIKKDLPAIVEKIREVRQRRLDEFAAAKEGRRLAREAKRAERVMASGSGAPTAADPAS